MSAQQQPDNTLLEGAIRRKQSLENEIPFDYASASDGVMTRTVKSGSAQRMDWLTQW